MDDIDFRRAEMVRLAEAVRERLSNSACVNNVSVVLHVDAVEQILNLANHVTALDSMLTEGTSTFPVRWMNDGTLGHESATRPAEKTPREVAEELVLTHLPMGAPTIREALRLGFERALREYAAARLREAAEVADTDAERYRLNQQGHSESVCREVASAIRALAAREDGHE